MILGVTYLIEPNELVVQAVIRDEKNFENPLPNYVKKGRKCGGLLNISDSCDIKTKFDSEKKKCICEFCLKKLSEICFTRDEDFGRKLYADKASRDTPVDKNQVELCPCYCIPVSNGCSKIKTFSSTPSTTPLKDKTSHLEIRPECISTKSYSKQYSCNECSTKKTKDEYTQCTYNAKDKVDKESCTCNIVSCKNESETKLDSSKLTSTKKCKKKAKSKCSKSKSKKSSKATSFKERCTTKPSYTSYTDDDDDTYYYDETSSEKKTSTQTMKSDEKCQVEKNGLLQQIVPCQNRTNRETVSKLNPLGTCCCDFRICSDIPVNNFMDNQQPACPNEVVYNRESLYNCTPSYCNALEKCLEKTLKVKLKQVSGVRCCANQQFVKRLSSLKYQGEDDFSSDYFTGYDDQYVYE